MAHKSWLPSWADRSRDAEQFRGFKTQIDSLFEDWFGRSMGGVLAPRIDMSEDERTVTLSAELPGVAEKDVEVSLAGDQLTIKGVKRSDHEDKREAEGFAIHRTERSYGAFQRTITVPYQISPEQVAAEFRGGVLTVRLPKPADALQQKHGSKIEINMAPQRSGQPDV